MRTVTLGIANSLDNYIARVDGAVDWLRWTSDVGTLMEEFWNSIDTVVMGRKTYEAAVGQGMASYPGMTNYVVSRTMTRPQDPAVEVAPDAVELVGGLKQQEGKGICVMGGGVLAHSLLEADLIDEIGLNIHPVLLGSGIPLFPTPGRQIELELRECRVLSSDCVYVLYRVARPGT